MDQLELQGIDVTHPYYNLEYFKWELSMRRASLEHHRAAVAEAEKALELARADAAASSGHVQYLEQTIAALSKLSA